MSSSRKNDLQQVEKNSNQSPAKIVLQEPLGITRKELDIVYLTAQIAASCGMHFEQELMRSVSVNPEFEPMFQFMNPTDSRRGFFDEVTLEYTRRLPPPSQYTSGGPSPSIATVLEIFFNIVRHVLDHKEEEVTKMDFTYFNDTDCFKPSQWLPPVPGLPYQRFSVNDMKFAVGGLDAYRDCEWYDWAMGCCSLDCFVYFVLSIALAFMAVSTTLPPPPDSNITKPNVRPLSHRDPLSLNASQALRQSNFKAIATLLHISPEIFLSSSSPNTTLFAIDDSSLFNTSSLPPLFLKQLLQYHTLPLRLPMKDLLEKPQGTCLPTLLRHKSVQISTVDKESRTAEVNHVMISHPDMFLGDSLVIHGVLGPFSPLQPHMDHIPHSSLCQSDTNKTILEEEEAVPVKIDWTRIIQLLSSNGFVPFAIGLHSVLNRIIADQHKNLTGITILATPSLVSLSSASPLLYEVMRRHIIAQRLTNKDLASMPDKALLKTLDPYQDLIITRTSVVNSSSQRLMISGVEIVAPDMFSSSNFVIHGISHTL
ncbi:unnamed protein product [Brassica rapa subsp. narinosa]